MCAKRLASLGLVALALGLLGASRAFSEDGLCVGDLAPKLGLKSFVKGDAITAFQPGTVYVLEFWATWCGPCMDAVPHVAAQQAKYPAVVFVGVDVFEHQPQLVRFSAQKMPYRVALDDVPEGKPVKEGFMAKNWLAKAEQSGIPTTFIIDGSGRIAWIGHPLNMDLPLKQIVAKSWDIEAAATAYRLQLNHNRLVKKLRKDFSAATKKSPAAGVNFLETALAQNEALFPELGLTLFRFRLDVPGDDANRALALGQKLIGGQYRDDADQLHRVAQAITQAKTTVAPGLLNLAVSASTRADELSGQKDAAIADTRAASLFAAGSIKEAVTVQERAVKLSAESEEGKDSEFVERLAKYKAALRADPGK